jgi:tRNA threonylcarbamoyladenosine biosynthesis protein TsaE
MRAIEIDLPSEAATSALGVRLAPLLHRGDVIALSGPLGAGKTTLARALIATLTQERDIPSPTFGLVAAYEASAFELMHFDLYRLERPHDVWELGLEDALSDAASLIEWPERIDALLPDHALAVRLTPSGAGRRARLLGGGDWGNRLASAGLAGLSESPKTAKQ